MNRNCNKESPMPVTRRAFLEAGVCGVGLLTAATHCQCDAAPLDAPPVRVITRGPKFHWFGYYDKLEFDPNNRFVLGMEADFEHRSPRPDDRIKVGMVDLADGDRWIELGESAAWCWQQGCMLQWLPQTESQVLWNDRDGDRYVCRILDVNSRELRTIPHAIYAVSPDGKSAVTVSFSRLNDKRPGYGYAGIPDPCANDAAPAETGIWRVDLESGQQELIITVADIARLGPPLVSMKDAKHYFIHLLYSPDGSRFIFLHRWTGPGGRETRMFTARPDGTDIRLVDDNGLTSHFIWRDPEHILALSRGMRFYLFDDTGKAPPQVVGKDAMTQDGHCSYLPGGEWILNDTYPNDGYQYPYLYHPVKDRKVSLGRFRAPAEYTGEWRCDTHPRCSRDGKMVVIDAPVASSGRQLHLIDVSSLVG
jgi:hypothetical protein